MTKIFITFLFFPAFIFSAETSMLLEAEQLSQLYSQEAAKTAPPSRLPLTDACLQTASIWFSLDLKDLATPNESTALDLLSQDAIWQMLKGIGFNGIHIQNLRKSGQLGIDPKWGTTWAKVLDKAEKQGLSLIGDLVGNATIAGPDFLQALHNHPNYINLYHLIEIAPKDWNLLPPVPSGGYETNIPWLTLQEFHKRGYVPEQFTPYIKESAWNATTKITCSDGKTRRWIYLKEEKNNPVLDWLSPSFAAYRLAAGDALGLTHQIGAQTIRLDSNLPQEAQDMISLWIRKIGAFSVAETNGTLDSIHNASTDLAYDTATRAALLHALIAQNAEALRMIYRLFLENGINTKRLVHVLQPFDQYACDWVELMNSPQKKFRYFEEQITGDILRQRLLKEDLFRLQTYDKLPLTTWVDHCARALNIKDFEKHREEITNAHILLSFTYAMQPGAFSISAADLLGVLPNQTDPLNLLETNPSTLYSSIPIQLKNPKSFASKLKSILAARKESNIAEGELIAIPATPHPGTLLLLHRLPSSRFIQLLAINFGRTKVSEVIEIPEITQTTAIDMMTKLAEEKVFSSARFSFSLPPLSARAFYFQPKYYD